MPIIKTRINKDSDKFISNFEYHKTLSDNLSEKIQKVREMGSPDNIEKHKARGKLTARERIELLIDKGSKFLELSEFAGMKLYDDDVPAGGIITGIVTVHNQSCMVIANDATVKGGTYFPITVKKHLRAQEIALENRLPCIYLVDSGGGFPS